MRLSDSHINVELRLVWAEAKGDIQEDSVDVLENAIFLLRTEHKEIH